MPEFEPEESKRDAPGQLLTCNQTSKITDWVKPGDNSGEFKRQQSSFREHISSEAGARYPPAEGRYHLYISYACPWVSTHPSSRQTALRWASTLTRSK